MREKIYSFELFPPKSEKGFLDLKKTVGKLSEKNIHFFSCTYGAGGSTQENTFATVDWLRMQQINTAPHLTCIGNSIEGTLNILERYKNQGVKRIVALRGDRPSGSGISNGDLNHANELVSLIKQEFGDYFHIEVAAYPEMHPQASNFSEDIKNFKRKIDAGANSAITQYFYSKDAYSRFVDQCSNSNIDIPIVPGVMPITNFSSLRRFSANCGAEIPRWICKRLEGFGDDLKSIREFGEEVVTDLCQHLLSDGAPGLHFYTMNRSEPTLALWNNLNLK